MGLVDDILGAQEMDSGKIVDPERFGRNDIQQKACGVHCIDEFEHLTGHMQPTHDID